MISTASIVSYLDKLKMYYVLIPGTILTVLNKGEEKGRFNQRVLITLNDSITWQGGVVALGDGDGYITLSKARMQQLNLRLDDKV
jgi:hypothetical protein